MSTRLSKIKNVVFDLGGVIINLDESRSFNRLAQISGVSSDQRDLSIVGDFFIEYEKGIMSDEGFRNGLREWLQINITDQEIDHIWNDMLLDIPKERIEVIASLKDRYRLFVLSNTNNIHILRFDEIVEEVTGHKGLYPMFDKVYYSHQLNKRKPEREIYEHVLEEQSLRPEETLFIDDKAENIKSAAQLNIQTIHVEKNNADSWMKHFM